MKALCDKYARKLAAQGLAGPEGALVGGLDAAIVWNREDDRTRELTGIFHRMSINSLVFTRPAEPYAGIIDYLAEHHPGGIRPEDTETRTFLHDIPVCRDFSAQAMADALQQRKAVIIPGHGIVSTGTVSPEQGFVNVSSTAFACFVLFFSEYLQAVRNHATTPAFEAAFDRAVRTLPPMVTAPPPCASGPFQDEKTVLDAMIQAGRGVVELGLVDSFFGNISYRMGNVVYISQTGSSLDELGGCIDPCRMDGSTTHGLTASSELSAHEDIYRRTDARCILHGHPKFSVIMSMDCQETDCAHRGQCHIHCDRCRSVDGIPIVPGEVGTGPTGLCHTLPPAMVGTRAAIVHGHGVFTCSETDFNQAFKRLVAVETQCRKQYFERVGNHARHTIIA